MLKLLLDEHISPAVAALLRDTRTVLTLLPERSSEHERVVII